MYEVLKRFFDLVFALILIVIFSPIMLLVAIAIKLDSEGPAIFVQTRSGKNGKEFKMYKFRSMSSNNDVHNFTTENKLTTVGKFIRSTSLDELPQLFNIVKGEMSFIGPRPWITDYEKYFTKDQKRRLEVLPGITGLAQASGRNDLSVKEKIKLDIYYVDHMSLWMDIKVIVGTVKAVLSKEGAELPKIGIKNELEELKEQPKEEKATA